MWCWTVFFFSTHPLPSLVPGYLALPTVLPSLSAWVPPLLSSWWRMLRWQVGVGFSSLIRWKAPGLRSLPINHPNPSTCGYFYPIAISLSSRGQSCYCNDRQYNCSRFSSPSYVGSADESLNPDTLPSAWHLISPVLEFIDIVPIPSSNLPQHFYLRMPGTLLSSKDFLWIKNLKIGKFSILKIFLIEKFHFWNIFRLRNGFRLKAFWLKFFGLKILRLDLHLSVLLFY